MWFKQLQVFALNSAMILQREKLIEQLQQLVFTPCLPSLPSSIGWVPPLEDNDSPLVQTLTHAAMLALQFEEKLLPASVIRQTLKEKIQTLEAETQQKIRGQDKARLKDEIKQTLLTQAFSKITRTHAYIDFKRGWLLLATTHGKKTEHFINLFKRCLDVDVTRLQFDNLGNIMTQWLLSDHSLNKTFAIEKKATLHDPNNTQRIIRCQQQNLFSDSIQGLIKDGCRVKQLSLTWQDRVSFILNDDFSFSNIHYHDELKSYAKDIGSETAQQQFITDFNLMEGSLGSLLESLIQTLNQASSPKQTNKPNIELLNV